MKEQHNPTTEQHVDKKRHEPTSSNRDGQVGQSFGNYDLVRRIDVGGMGEVYLATDTKLGRDVVVEPFVVFGPGMPAYGLWTPGGRQDYSL